MAKKDTSKLEGDPFKLIETDAPGDGIFAFC